MPVSKTRRKKNGRPVKGGRFAFSANPSQTIAFKMLGYGLIMITVLALSASSLNDSMSTQTGTFQMTNDSVRQALARKSANTIDGVRALNKNQITRVFGVPSLQRQEEAVTIWHYASDFCALDLYFPAHDSHQPEYAEYRVFAMNELFILSTKGNPNDTGHRDCVQDLLHKASMPKVDLDADLNTEQAQMNATRS